MGERGWDEGWVGWVGGGGEVQGGRSPRGGPPASRARGADPCRPRRPARPLSPRPTTPGMSHNPALPTHIPRKTRIELQWGERERHARTHSQGKPHARARRRMGVRGLVRAPHPPRPRPAQPRRLAAVRVRYQDGVARPLRATPPALDTPSCRVEARALERSKNRRPCPLLSSLSLSTSPPTWPAATAVVASTRAASRAAWRMIGVECARVYVL